ncbi:hypothetical protein [Streptomyces paludis]|uniref:Uncharacterized protein n=1 Tax=Streptomyces paludis TaxID=2282738 RepID=A0A345HST8_9ACTN|nr:hypothetical protein [Streptomyces paludis]AXG79762.1 hypothetical protein DVK44_21275 [Streptomyces paludis]
MVASPDQDQDPDRDQDQGQDHGHGQDRDALLADRTEIMAELARRGLSVGRLAVLWLLGAVGVAGWAAVGLAVRSVETGGLGVLTGLVSLVLALVLLVPAAIGAGKWLNGGRDVRQRLEAWAALGRVTDSGLRVHARCVGWLLPSVALCLLGLATVLPACVAIMDATDGSADAESFTLGGVTYSLGLGATVLLTGLLGLFQTVDHQLWAERLLHPVPVRRGGGAHR